jgi:hypothetical protein
MINLKYFTVFLSLPVASTLVFVNPSYAFRLSFTPTGDIVKKPGEPVEFFLSMSDFGGKTLSQLSFNFDFDNQELIQPDVKEAPNSGAKVIKNNNQKSYTITNLNEKNPGGGFVSVGSVGFKVVKPIDDGKRDFWLTGATANANTPVVTAAFAALATGNTSSEETVNISPEYANIIPSDNVPEPLTILGSLTALGFGTLLKKRYSKKLEKQTT